jgi:hypothetical protein
MVNTNNPNYSFDNDAPSTKKYTPFLTLPPAGGPVTFPAGVTSIGNWAFNNNTSLTSITIPASVTEIGDRAFDGCSSLTSITVDTNNPRYAGEGGVLYNKEKTALIAYPSASGTVTIPGSVTSIGVGAFNNNTSLTGITIPEGVTEIGNSTFYGCTSLTSITIPAGVTSIGNSTFYRCTSLTSITIPEGVTEIGGGAFYDCSSLTSLTIPASVTTIGFYAFDGWTNTQTIYIEGHASQAAADAMWGGSSWRRDCNATIVYQGGN